MKPPAAVVMNMFYTGLGIATSLGENGVPVIGLTSQRGVYGNFTRYAKIVFSPDSRHEPEALLEYLLRLGGELGHGTVLFPTRDDDVIFLDRFREQLGRLFKLEIPASAALTQCLDKWKTYQAARRAEVPTPRSWLIDNAGQIRLALPEISFPCVLKPVEAYHWRAGRNWDIVGGRKAFAVSSAEDLMANYAVIERANHLALIQEMVPGGDDCLVIAACYMGTGSHLVAGFNTQKLVQEPEGFGSGCVVQTADLPELFEPTVRLLQELRYTGIAEVEYKRDARDGQYKLIEINPRPWDQHRLGKACGVDLVYLAYRDLAGMEVSKVETRFAAQKWIADDAFLAATLRLLWHRDPKLKRLFGSTRGRKIHGIWSAKDPLPFLAYFTLLVFPKLLRLGVQAIWSSLLAGIWRKARGESQKTSLDREPERSTSATDRSVPLGKGTSL